MTTNVRRALMLGLAGTSMLAAACGAPEGNLRRDALWAEYRRSAGSTAARGDGATLFAGEAELDRDALVAAVLARNPSVERARAGLRAMLAEADAAGSFDDPMVSYAIAPLSVVGEAPFGHRIEVRQMLPFPGKRRLAREAALAAAEAESGDIAMVQLELAQMASELFDEYHVVARALEINQHHRALVTEMQKSAEIQYAAGRGSAQDPIQAEVELAEMGRERLQLESQRGQIVARLNGLMHRPPEAPLPPPPSRLELATAPEGTSEQLQERALARRPQRESAQARIRAAQAEVAMAERDFYPDLELMASYDSMWDMPEHRWMVGVMVEVPVQRGKRHAAVARAEAETEKLRYEDERVADEIRVEVERAHRRVVEAEQIVELDEKTVLPAVRARLDAARAGFASAQNDFMAVVQAEQALRAAELELEMSRAELSMRRAMLSREVGLVPGMTEGGAP